ncbi:aldose 1-epimerase family protein [Nocardioides acrostichi]|uniref:Aldose 1-epimerase family protein n=1 Tax=Nocardioides acrostichi TaxID=2784339 RepID=A0A930V4R5_9ACTN|nr:aldose 1-epimerase family protein [Nocardioides acrostichi]MBF4163159.1 aldose 1-epimerase family protein [Nocardioides acrostichi]
MTSPSGEQFEIAAAGYRAVVTESGGALRLLEHEGRALLDGFGEHEMAPGGRGQLLVPWPNRTRDGRYSFDGRDLQLALTEPSRHNASHGLVRWVAFTLEEHTSHSVTLTYRVMAQTGYPWSLDVAVSYDLSADGLTVTQSASNLADSPAPYAAGAHPYLLAGEGPVDGWELTLPASTRVLADGERLLPTGYEPVDDTAFDFRVARPVRDTVLNDGFTDLLPDERGVTTTVLRDPAAGTGVALWADDAYTCLQLYTADDVPASARRSMAIEPMTAPADALNSGVGLVVLEPGESHTATWGIRSVD